MYCAIVDNNLNPIRQGGGITQMGDVPGWQLN
jgi:hypothetical protein